MSDKESKNDGDSSTQPRFVLPLSKYKSKRQSHLDQYQRAKTGDPWIPGQYDFLTCKIGPEFLDKNRMMNLRHLQIRSTIR